MRTTLVSNPAPLPLPRSGPAPQHRSLDDGCDMAHWFARPNSALAGGAPLQHIACDPDAVLQAALVCTAAPRFQAVHM
jgi:hypothetical protein